MNTRFDSIKKFCSEQYQIIVHISLLKYDIKFYYEASDQIKSMVLTRFRLIARIHSMTIRLLIIQLYVLLKEDQKFSFKKLEKLVKKESIFYNKNKQEWDTVFRHTHELEQGERWTRIKNLRNKHYAHVDNLRHEFPTNINMKELVDFSESVEKIYAQIFRLIHNGADLQIDHLSNQTGHFMYEALLAYQKIWSLYESYELSLDEEIINPEAIKKILYDR